MPSSGADNILSSGVCRTVSWMSCGSTSSMGVPARPLPRVLSEWTKAPGFPEVQRQLEDSVFRQAAHFGTRARCQQAAASILISPNGYDYLRSAASLSR